MGERITMGSDGKLLVPDCPEIPFIEGDGIGGDIWNSARAVLDAAVERAYHREKKIDWVEIYAGEKGFEKNGIWLSDDTLNSIEQHRVAIKGPLATPVGKGMRSLNVKIRQSLDLYACIRPVQYYPPVPTPVKAPEKVDITIFRENTEDLYAGIEWDSGSVEAEKILRFMEEELGQKILSTASIGIKPMSPDNTKRLVKRAVQFALDNGLASVTLMHKGNIMKFTEGGFRKWGYEVALESFGDQVVLEKDLYGVYDGKMPEGKVLIKDRIADMVFAEVLLRPEAFDVIAAPNLNGDYISDALAAQVGGLGLAPGANMGDRCAVFEATHGTAPDIAGKDLANPSSIILSGAMMLDHLGWDRAAALVRQGLSRALQAGRVTGDLAGIMPGAEQVACSTFGKIIIETIQSDQV
ncbi:MAG TPA: NADP-dependent isocitrate dehydrogenase [Desulfobacteraceae bacterium]|nr:NADP-dependent isocitrate dehydrogenase [Desulfobacteraceae bacterium]